MERPPFPKRLCLTHARSLNSKHLLGSQGVDEHRAATDAVPQDTALHAKKTEAPGALCKRLGFGCYDRFYEDTGCFIGASSS